MWVEAHMCNKVTTLEGIESGELLVGYECSCGCCFHSIVDQFGRGNIANRYCLSKPSPSLYCNGIDCKA